MNLFSIVIALLLEKFIPALPDFRRLDWLSDYVNIMRARMSHLSWFDGPGGLVVSAGLIVLLIALLDLLLVGIYPGLSFLFGLVILVYCMGPRELIPDLDQVTEAMRRGDFESADIHAEDLLGTVVAEEPHPLAERIKAGIFIQANMRVLGVMLWFVLLGPVGAVMFRIACQLKQRFESEQGAFAMSCRRFYEIMIWIPVRVTILCFAIVGNFIDTMIDWRAMSDFWKRDSEELLVISGLGAIRHEKLTAESGDEIETDINIIQHSLELVKRAVVFWVVVLAVMTLAGWLF